MTPSDVFEISQQSVFTLLEMIGPTMAIALGVGLLVALFQALTSIQEITLTFVPKIVIVFVALIFLMPMMADALFQFSEEIFSRIAQG